MKNLVKKIAQKSYLGISFMTILAIGFTGCSKEDIARKSTNKASFYATDAPIDNAEVEAVFVTVAGLNVNGKEVEGFQKTTLELSALTNGKTQFLDDVELEANSINSIEVLLDFDSDEMGNAPGSYVLKADGSVDALASSSNTITIIKDLRTYSNDSNNIVLDFDLRKMIREESDGDYEFVTESELSGSVRAVVKSETGTVKGRLNDSAQIKGKAIAYLYKKGTFTRSEISGEGESKIEFYNAVNSATVSANGEFMISFAEDGEYELHIFEYDDTNNDGRLEIVGEIQLSSAGSINLNGFNVDAESTTEIGLNVTAILPL